MAHCRPQRVEARMEQEVTRFFQAEVFGRKPSEWSEATRADAGDIGKK